MRTYAILSCSFLSHKNKKKKEKTSTKSVSHAAKAGKLVTSNQHKWQCFECNGQSAIDRARINKRVYAKEK